VRPQAVTEPAVRVLLATEPGIPPL
jgi:hypothetical protein